MKKSILQTFIVCCMILLPVAILYQSCRKQDHVKQVNYDLTVADGKEIYEKAGPELQARFGNTYGQLEPRWSESKFTRVSARDAAMYTQLGFNKQTGAYLQLVTMKNKGKLRSIITEMKPTADFYAKYPNPYYYPRLSGKLLFYTVTGKFVKGFTMKLGSSEGAYYPEEELSNPSVLNRVSGAQGINTAPDPCEGKWGTFGCQELETVVVTATPVSGGTTIIYISLPIEVFYDFPTGGEYSGYYWTPLPDPTPTVPSDYEIYEDITLAWGEPCPNSFRFKNISPTEREALVWGLHFSFRDLNDVYHSTTFGLNIRIPSDITYNAGQTYAWLRQHFNHQRVSSSDLRLVTDANGVQHVMLSQVAQTQLAVDAVHYANWKAIEVNDVAMIAQSKTSFHYTYALDVALWLNSRVPGASAHELNTKIDGTTPYKQQGFWAGCD